jgi:ABC-type glutathione transport system ATPase component
MSARRKATADGASSCARAASAAASGPAEAGAGESGTGADARDAPLLAVVGLSVELETESGTVRPVDGVSFTLRRGRTLGIVGESGAGKTLTALSLAGLTLLEGARVTGSIRLAGRELVGLRESELRAVRGEQIAIVFQDALAALHPLYRIGSQLAEAIRAHRPMGRAAAREHARELLQLVGIDDPGRRLRQYPHELSGGQRQRAMIALALAGDPRLLIADEPTTALDASVQAEIVALLRRLQRERAMAVLLISHDLGLVAELADEVAVMQGGRIVERGPLERVLSSPEHRHTRELIAAMPTLAGAAAAGAPAAWAAGGRAAPRDTGPAAPAHGRPRGDGA